MSRNDKPARSTIPIAPGSTEQTQGRRLEMFGSSGTYRPIELPARVRTSHACDRCRELRAKCSGGTRCAKCTKDDATCLYSDRKRERNKKNLVRSAQQIDDLQQERALLLTTLKSLVDRPDFDEEKYSGVLEVIEKVSRSQTETLHSAGASHHLLRSASPDQITDDSPAERATSGGPASAGESLVRSDVGSPDRLRELASAVDLDHGNGMPGYVGKMSDVSWMQRIRSHLNGSRQLGEPEIRAADIDIQSLDTGSMSYFIDDVNLLAIDEDYIDPHIIPNWHVAQVLTEAYFSSVQGSFRFVERTEFLRDLQGVYETVTNRITPSWSQRRTLALANMMWAVGARWIGLCGLNDRQVPDHGKGLLVEDQLMYYARARSLGLDHRMQLEHPSLELVQGMGVLGLYLLSNGSVHRAWNMVAQTIRHATALGLHLKVLPGVFTVEELRRRARVWWSLFRLEVMLSDFTGRPKCINDSDITAPVTSLFPDDEDMDTETPSTSQLQDAEYTSIDVWHDFLRDNNRIPESFSGGIIPWSDVPTLGSDTNESHFVAALELSGLVHKVGASLYLSPADFTWADVQTTVRGLEADVARWEKSLHPELRIDNIAGTSSDPRSNLDLELGLCSVRMILYRPFLCDIRIEAESDESVRFNQESARGGVKAAIRITEILPDEPVAEHILFVLPWWTLLHLISQATAVLLLELCLNVQHMQDETVAVMMALRKALNYIWALAPTSKCAYRAWHIYRPMVAKVAQKYRKSVLTEIPVNAERPPGWHEHDERLLQAAIPRLAS